MEIKKLDNHYEIEFKTAKFLVDPPRISEDNYIILTDVEKNLNRDKIFNSPGEYNIGEVYFRGFANKNKLSFLFEEEDERLFYFDEKMEENVKKEIRMISREIEVIFSPNFNDIDTLKEFKTKVLITEREINLPKFNKEKGSKIKINSKKVDNLVFILK